MIARVRARQCCAQRQSTVTNRRITDDSIITHHQIDNSAGAVSKELVEIERDVRPSIFVKFIVERLLMRKMCIGFMAVLSAV